MHHEQSLVGGEQGEGVVEQPRASISDMGNKTKYKYWMTTMERGGGSPKQSVVPRTCILDKESAPAITKATA